MDVIIDELTARYPVLEVNRQAIRELVSDLVALFRDGGRFFIAGNGGSAADAEHICGELLKGFCSKRELSAADLAKLDAAGAVPADGLHTLQYGLPAISLMSHPALISAFGNDVAPDLAFAQQLWALGRPGDMVLGISTGGNAENIRKCFIAARAAGIRTVLLTGNRHGCCEQYADLVIAVPEAETYKIQELHLPIYHAVCLAVEKEIFY